MMLPAEFRICTLLVLGVLHTVCALGWRLVFESIFELSPPGWVVWSRALHKSTRQAAGYERTQGPSPISSLCTIWIRKAVLPMRMLQIFP